MIPFMFQKGNKSAGCEDSPPVATLHYSIVCDGLGGSGNTKHDVFEGGNKEPTKRTSAYLGSRIVSDCVEKFFQTHIGEFISSGLSTRVVEPLIQEMKKDIINALSAGLGKYHIEPTRSRTLKTFPTTLASAIYCPSNGGLKVLAIWTGDSRIYILSPSQGLQLLSVDDADGAADSMNSSSAMNNCISVGNPFRINFALYEMNEPGLVFCCTDGCFDYIPSPLNLEWALLNTILDCMPACDNSQLGNTLAASIRDSVYPDNLLGDDTTMAGICFQISSQALMKKLYQPRMDRFCNTAIQMNQHLKTLKAVQKEREAAQRTCRLYEGKVTDAIQKAVCDALNTHYPAQLYGFLSNMPTYAAYRDLEEKTNHDITSRCNTEIDSLQEKANALRLECRSLLKTDYLKWRRITDDQSGIPSFLGGLRSGRSIDRANPNKAYLNPEKLEPSLEAVIELFSRKELTSLISFSHQIEDDYEKFVQRQTDAIRTVISMLHCQDELFIDLWGQAYFSTPRFARERDELERDRYFVNAFESALADPRSCPFCSELTERKIAEYRAMLSQRESILDKYTKERQRSMAALPSEYYRQNKETIIEELLCQPSEVLRSLLTATVVPLDRLVAFVDARTKLRNIDVSIQQAQASVDQLWSQYRIKYELFKQVFMKGVS